MYEMIQSRVKQTRNFNVLFAFATILSILIDIDWLLSNCRPIKNEFMERVCGDATIEAARTAADVGVYRFDFILSAQVGRIDLKENSR